jgi:hypothetical protein
MALPLRACAIGLIVTLAVACSEDESASPATAAGTTTGSGGSGQGAGGTGATAGTGGTGLAGGGSVGGAGGQSWTTLTATNPVLTGNHPDPHVLRIVESDGTPTYYLTHTSGNGGDLPIYTSRNLLDWQQLGGAFDRTRVPGNSIEVNGAHFCALWAPEIAQVTSSEFLLSFSAQRYAAAQSPCPAYAEDGGVYVASSSSPTGPFAIPSHSWEPLAAGGHITNCASSVASQIPHSVPYASGDCQGGFCHHIIRLDSNVYQDPSTSRWWMAYSWYTNTPPQVQWERDNHGEHIHIVELDAADPWTVRCDVGVPQIFAANCHDAATLSRLSSYCPRCDEMLSMTRGRQHEEMMRDGYSWGVVEGASLWRLGDLIYLFASGSAWDSAYYHVFWAAAPTVAGLAYDNPSRLVGRYLIPSQGQAFGHGSPVLGPDGQSLYYVHHRLDHEPCRTSGQCSRDLWVSPIELEDRGDGLGAVYVAPRFPAEDPSVSVRVPATR